MRQNNFYTDLITFLFFSNIFLSSIAITSVILSGISFDQSKDNDNTYYINNTTNTISYSNDFNITSKEWIQYNFTGNLQIPETQTYLANVNTRFSTDNESFVSFIISSASWSCFNNSGIYYVSTNSSIPSFLIPKNSDLESINTARYITNTYKGESTSTGYFFIRSDGIFEFYFDINGINTWSSNIVQFCASATVSGSYLLNTII
jgi:hypothetical protein